MFEYLIDLCEEEKIKFAEAERVKKPYLNINDYQREQGDYKKNNGGAPASSADKVNYYMGLAIKGMANGILTSPANEIQIIGKNDEENRLGARYLWTAYMLLGHVLPHKFNHTSIKNYVEGFNEKAEMGYFWGFSATSLYETGFKQHLNEASIRRFLVNSTQAAVDRRKFEANRVAKPYVYQPYLIQKKLYELGSEGLAQFFVDLPAEVTQLDLYGQELYRLGALELVEALRALPPRITLLRLRYNAFNYLSSADLALIFAAVPSSVTWFDISGNYFCYIGDAVHERKCREETGLVLAFSALHDKITTLVLDIARPEIFKAMPKSVTKLFLSGAYPLQCHGKSAESRDVQEQTMEADELVKIFKDLPEHIVSPDTDLINIARRRIQAIQSDIEHEKRRKNERFHHWVKKFDVTTSDIKSHLSHGADINYQDHSNGYTALMIAVDAQNERIAEYLLKQGANPLLKNKSGELASELAATSSPVYQLLKNWELRCAVSTANLPAAQSAYRTGADVNFQGSDGSTALMNAITQQNEEFVKFLLVRGAEISLTCDDGKSALDLANPNMKALLIKDDEEARVESLTTNSFAFFTEREEVEGATVELQSAGVKYAHSS